GVDASAALALAGVRAVVTAKDLKKILKNVFPDPPGSETGEHASEDIAEDDGIPVPKVAPLADGKVRYVGEPVAAIVAESRAVAEDAIELVNVDYEPLEAVIDPYAAREPGAPQIYDEVKNNISVREQTVHGDVDGAFASSPVK